MKTASFWLVLLAALPCSAGDKKISDDLNVDLLNGGQNGQAVVIVQFSSDLSA